MRYLSILFFFFLSLHSYFVFAQPAPTCTSKPTGLYFESYRKTCESGGGFFYHFSTVSGQKRYQCQGQCTCQLPYSFSGGACNCPANTTFSEAHDTCLPDSCPSGQIVNVVVVNGIPEASCIDDPNSVPGPEDPESCQESEKVYDPVSGAMVCPASGDGGGSSSASSQTCVVPNDFNGDCIPDDEQGSSAANSSSPASTPTSSPDSGSSGSAASTGGGGDDDGDDPSTGGGGDNGGGNNSGGGSASSSASASGGGSGSGSNSSWTPNSGYGNWIPVNPNSPCPNKYQDKDGQWWCWGGQSNSVASNSAGSAGSASSGANSSSPYGGGGECDDEPVCPEGDIECLQFIQQWHTRCGGEKIDSKFFEMADQGDAEASFSKSFTNFKTELEKLPNTQHIQNFFQFNAAGSCPVWQVNVWVFDVVIDQQCSSDIPWDLIAGVIIAVSVLLAARIALT